MRLHENKELFADAIQAASRGIDDGGLGIRTYSSKRITGYAGH